MPRSESEHPTELELEILKVLWEESPLPVREVRARLQKQAHRPLAHSSVITMLNIMHRKGFLRRRKEGKSFWFWPTVPKEKVTGRIMGDMLSRVFNGSPSAMVLNLLQTADVNTEELAEIRKLIARKTKEAQQ
jgi:BlaI family transcriptional regulator, penicillinase repressor